MEDVRLDIVDVSEKDRRLIILQHLKKSLPIIALENSSAMEAESHIVATSLQAIIFSI